MGAILDQRRDFTATRLEDLVANLGEAEKVITDNACVYVTGSGGRGEMSEWSDLDLFIVSEVEEARQPERKAKPKLSKLDAILVKAPLITAARNLGYVEFSQDGKFLEMHTTEELCEKLGRPDDDQANTFTARLLLLLESRPLLGAASYWRVIEDVIAAYWTDYEGHQDSFRPVFLVNDIIRMWKTFCVNYEAFTEKQPDDKRAKRRLKNYKLKHSRVLTCYSAILYLLQVFASKSTVHPADVRAMVERSPTQRLEWIATQPGFRHRGKIDELLACYEQFLESTNRSEGDLVEIFADDQRRRTFTRDQHQVASILAELLQAMGSGNALYRFLVV
jgi:predicted nucleotidyltransferase